MSLRPNALYLLTILGLSGAAIAQDATVPDDFATIQGALNGATDLDADGVVRIHVRAGTYFETLVIARDQIELFGDGIGQTTISGNGTHATLAMQSGRSGIELHDLSITGGGASFDGIQATHILGLDLHDLEVYGNRDGIRLNSADGGFVQNCIVRDNAHAGIEAARGSGATIQGNQAFGNGSHGIDVQGATGFFVLGNTATGNQDAGIRVRRSLNVLVDSNIATQNTSDGLRIENTVNVVVSSNQSTGNLENGLRMRSTSGSLITLNTLSSNGTYGIRMQFSTNDDFDSGSAGIQGPMGDNTATGNGHGPLRID